MRGNLVDKGQQQRPPDAFPHSQISPPHISLTSQESAICPKKHCSVRMLTNVFAKEFQATLPSHFNGIFLKRFTISQNFWVALFFIPPQVFVCSCTHKRPLLKLVYLLGSCILTNWQVITGYKNLQCTQANWGCTWVKYPMQRSAEEMQCCNASLG